jgi:hypothetical protein
MMMGFTIEEGAGEGKVCSLRIKGGGRPSFHSLVSISV